MRGCVLYRIVGKLDTYRTSVQSALQWLRRNGYVDCHGMFWMITDAGRALTTNPEPLP